MVKFTFVSDLHTFHPEVNNNRILRFVNELKYNHSDSDVIILMGDQFNQLVSYGNPGIALVQDKFRELALFAKSLNIPVYILKGTASHDANQNESLVSSMKSIYEKVYYMDDLSVIKIGRYDVAFYPDPGQIESEAIFKELSVLPKVDILLTHMSYDYNSVYKAVDESRIMELVNIGVLSGHVHQHNVIHIDDKFICSIGSYEKLEHGTSDVGIVTMELSDMHKPILTHFKNKNTFLYEKVYSNFNIDTVKMFSDREGIIKFVCTERPNAVSVTECKLLYPSIKLQFELISESKEEEIVIKEVDFTLDRETIIPILLEETELSNNEIALRILKSIKVK